MSTHQLRLLDPSELRPALDLFLNALHQQPISDEDWVSAGTDYDSAAVLGAFEDARLVGTATTWPSRLAVPGGDTVPMAAVSRVAVRADRTRRGVLTTLLRTRLAELYAEGVTTATLRATEALIYGRFGFGVATRGRTVAVDRRRSALHPQVPTGGEVRLLEHDQIVSLLPAVFDAIGPGRPGWVQRWPAWWHRVLRRARGKHLAAAVHTGPDGDDGFVVYAVTSSAQAQHGGTALQVQDLVAGSDQAVAGLWSFVLGVDLVDEVEAELRPLDEPVELLLTDRRACAVRAVDDETWLRLVHVPDALAARRYGDADPVVIAMDDPLLPDNRGHYRISSDGVTRTAAPAQLSMDVSVLASAYLGDARVSALAAAGLVRVADEAALARADRLFATDQAPWAGTFF